MFHNENVLLLLSFLSNQGRIALLVRGSLGAMMVMMSLYDLPLDCRQLSVIRWRAVKAASNYGETASTTTASSSELPLL